jgi:hypothetical protein
LRSWSDSEKELTANQAISRPSLFRGVIPGSAVASRESAIETFKAGVRHAAWSDAKPKLPSPILGDLQRVNVHQSPQVYNVDRLCQSQETMELNEGPIMALKKWEHREQAIGKAINVFVGKAKMRPQGSSFAECSLFFRNNAGG